MRGLNIDRGTSRQPWLAMFVAVIGSFAVAGPLAAAPQIVSSMDKGVTFAVPPYCAIHQGPGTLDAVCDPDGDSDKSRAGPAASALYFEVAIRSFPDEKGMALDTLRQRYTLDAFQKGLADKICGEEKPRRVTIEGAEQSAENGSLSYGATVTCPGVRFLGLGPRRASVRYVLRDGQHYEIQARALVDDFDRVKGDVDAFFDSLKFSPEKTP